MAIDLRLISSGGQWTQSEKDTSLSGSIPVSTPADTWVDVLSVNEECLVLNAGVRRDLNSTGTTSIRIVRDGVEFGVASSSSVSNKTGSALVGRWATYSESTFTLIGDPTQLHCRESLLVQVKNSVVTTTPSDGLYSIDYSKGEMK